MSHQPSTKAYHKRQLDLWLSRASAYKRATDECDGSTPGHCGSGTAALALSLRRCRAIPYTSSVMPRFSNMLLSPPPFRVRSVVRLRVICLELRPPVVTIPAVRDMAHVVPASGSPGINLPPPRLLLNLSLSFDFLASPCGTPDLHRTRCYFLLEGC